MILAVGHVEIAEVVDRNPGGQVELPVAAAGAAELALVDAFQVEYLDAVVLLVDDVDAVGIDVDGSREVELPVAGAADAPGCLGESVLAVHLHTVVARIQEVHAPVIRECHVLRSGELTEVYRS